jgi:gliding motility-associated-like protein
MKRYFSILLLNLLPQYGNAQNADLKWVKQIGGVSSDEVQAITVDDAGNIYTTGFFTETVDFDPGPGVTNLTAFEDEDAFVCKMDNAGNLVWARRFEGTNYQTGLTIAVDAAGNVYTGGIFFGRVDFDPGPATFFISVFGNKDDFVCKLSSSGDFVWAKQLGGTTNDRLTSLTIDNQGNLLLTGYFNGVADFDPAPSTFYLTSTGDADIFLLKLDAANGNFIWVDQVGGASFDASYSVKTNAAGDVFICGFFLGTVDFDPGAGTSLINSFGDDDAFILKLDKDGKFIWVKRMGGNLYDRANSLCLDKNNNILIAGYFDGTADFDPGAGVFSLTALGNDDAFIVKLDSNGVFNWAKSMGGTSFQRPYIITSDDTGAVYTVGYFDGLTDFDPGSGVFNISSVANLDIFVSKLDANGNFLWVKQFGGPAFEAGYALFVDRFKNVYTAGSFDGTVDFDPNSGVYNLTTKGSKDIFIHKIKQCPFAATVMVLNIDTCKTYTLNNEVFTASGTYYRIITDIAGCDSLTITLNLKITRTATSVGAVICDGESYYAGGSQQTRAGTYYDTLQNISGCDSVIITNLKVKPSPKPELGPDRDLCAGEKLVLRPGNFSNYLWHDGSTGPEFNVRSIGKYWVSIVGSNQCIGSDTLTIFAIDSIPVNFLPPNQELCLGNSLKLSVPNYLTYQWSTGSTDNFSDIKTFGLFYLTVKDFNLCTGTDSITILRANCVPIGVPNAFTPDGNTINDIFKPTIYQQVNNYSFQVFNRYGQKVFETREYGKGWDGTLNGRKQPSGNYVYRIKYSNIFGRDQVENGTVLLIR